MAQLVTSAVDSLSWLQNTSITYSLKSIHLSSVLHSTVPLENGRSSGLWATWGTKTCLICR